MFSQHLIWNHRARLTALLTLTVSITLACVFAIVIVVVRAQALNRRISELEQGVRTTASEWTGPGSLDDDLPGIDSAVYSADGRLQAADTKTPPAAIAGLTRSVQFASYGYRAGQNLFVGRISLAETEAGLRQLIWILAALWLPLTFLTAAASWYGGGLVLRPIRELVSSAERLSALADQQLLTTNDRAEYAALVESLNHLIAKVRRSASLQEQFASDAAHELRNPLAILRMRIETNLRRERSIQEHVDAQRAMLGQIERLTSIVETLLSSARMPEDGAEPLRFDLAVSSAVRDWIISREFCADLVEVKTAPCEVAIREDEVGILLANLLDNSARHSPPEARIEVHVGSINGEAFLDVRDFGKGLSEEEARHAFDRFYRSDEGRNREAGGLGIGLSVVKRIVESRLGSIDFVPADCGALVRVTLPCSSDVVATLSAR